MADTAFLVLVVLSMLLNLLVYTPILIYWIAKIYKYRHSFVIKKRLPTLLIALIALSILYFSIEKTIQLYTMGDIMGIKSKLALNKVIFYVFQIPFIYFLWFYVLRFWLLYYKLEWSLSMMNNEWKSIINHNNASDDWFIIYRQKYGSLRYLQKKLIIAVSIITLIVVLSWILYWEAIEPGVLVWTMYIFFVFGPPTLVLFYVAYKLPHYDDYLALKDELKYSCYGFIAVIAILILFFAIINSVTGLSSNPYLSLFLWHVIVLWNFTMITLHTHWVVKRFDPVLRRHRNSDASLFSDLNRTHTKNDKNRNGHNMKNNNNNNMGYNGRKDSTQQFTQNKATYKLQQIVKHPKAYDLFMHHLWKEHSSECLLSSTEFIQFQYLIIYHHEAMNMNSNENTISELDDDIDLNQLSPEIPQSSIVFGANPTNKISVYIHNKLNPSFQPEYVHKKSIFNGMGTQKLGINTALVGVARNLANAVSPSKGKSNQHININNNNNKQILAMSQPINNNNNHRHRIRHSISGKIGLRQKPKPRSKKIARKRHSLSSNKPVLSTKRSNSNSNKDATTKVIRQSQSHSAFQIKLNINTSHLVQANEPKSPPKYTSNDEFYKKPIKPKRSAPCLPTQLHKQVNNNIDITDNDKSEPPSPDQPALPPLPLNHPIQQINNVNINKSNKSQLQLNHIGSQVIDAPNPSNIRIPSNSELIQNSSADTDYYDDDDDDDDDESSLIIHPTNSNHQYSGVPISSGDTPTLREQYIDPNTPPLPPLKPLPPSPPKTDKKQQKRGGRHTPITIMTKSKSLPPDPTSPTSPINQVIGSVNIHCRGIQTVDMDSEGMILTTPTDLDDDDNNNDNNIKRKRTHKRTLSLRDRFNGLVQSTSLRKLGQFSSSNHSHRRTQSGKMVVFNDDDSIESSEEEKDELPEDPVIAQYKSMNVDELYSKKIELIRKYREIAYHLWIKYVKVGAEYEINIDFATRKRFAKLMMNKDEWLNNDKFNEKELHILFNPCVQRMFVFLSNSFTRFRDKPDFDRVQEFLII